jgi:hypothetical protein
MMNNCIVMLYVLPTSPFATWKCLHIQVDSVFSFSPSYGGYIATSQDYLRTTFDGPNLSLIRSWPFWDVFSRLQFSLSDRHLVC